MIYKNLLEFGSYSPTWFKENTAVSTMQRSCMVYPKTQFIREFQ